MAKHELEETIEQISEEYKAGNLSKDERDYLLTEVRDVQAAESCAGNENLLRNIVKSCNVAMSIL